jgi:hypothetical protein
MQRQGKLEYIAYNECKQVRLHTPSPLQGEEHQQDIGLYKPRNQNTDPHQLRRQRQAIWTHYLEMKPLPKTAPTPSFPLKDKFLMMNRLKYRNLIIF